MNLKIWFLETRPHFLLLTPVYVFLGAALAYYETSMFNILHLALALIGALLAHMSVNVLNDYFDYISGIDLKVAPTPLSGGSRILPAGLLRPGSVYWFGVASLALTFTIGIYFVYTVGWLILPLGLLGILVIYLYTPILSKFKFLSEPSAGLFALMVMGTYYTQTAYYSLSSIAVSLISFFLVANLLLLNEFPDVDADKVGGRRHIPIVLGRRRAAKVYLVFLLAAYTLLALYILLGILPVLTLMGFVTLPLAIKASRGALKYYDEISRLIPYMIVNVQIVLLLPIAITLGLLLTATPLNIPLTVSTTIVALIIIGLLMLPRKGGC